VELISVLAVLAALAASGHYLKRHARLTSPARRLSVEQRVSIANGCELVLVRLDKEELLLAAGASGCTLLKTGPTAPAPPPAVVEMHQEHRACVV